MAFMQCEFFSEVLGLSCSMNVLLPQETKKQIGMEGRAGGGRFPVLYLLHGMSDNHTIWMRRTSIERYAAPLGLAVVMPAVGRSFYVDTPYGAKYGEFISHELPETVRSFFPVSSRREDTFVAGLSMGGYGAFLLALSHPAKFAAAASLSGALNVADLDKLGSPDNRMRLEQYFGLADKIHGSKYDLFALASRLSSGGKNLPRLYQCCGKEDFLYEDNIKFRKHMRKLRFDYTYDEGPGAHDWSYWDTQIQKVLRWMLPEKQKKS